ncbi:DEAD/DEAH box helicase [Chlamydiales bacterium]|nr:DEAD/DEAH box helicase [Chlamydiales bacterium]
MSFKQLDPQILKTVTELGYREPTPIQEEAIPKVLEGVDILASAQTGTGKTAAFLLPAIQKIMTPSTKTGKGARVLILVPTRELAMQVSEESVKFTKRFPQIKTVCIFGGVPYPVQNRQLSHYHEILVATPGRLIDHLNRGRINFSRLELLILDEADRMLDMGFVEPVLEIKEHIPEKVQTLLFSATLKGQVLNLSKKLLENPVSIAVAQKKENHNNIEQSIYHADQIRHKNQLLVHHLNDESIYQAIVFTARKHYADQLVLELKESGHKAAALHGDMDQRRRSRTIQSLRDGKVRILVATDVAARGIDVQSITHVINFDLPSSAEDYVHRIGRTGRADAKGKAISFVLPSEHSLIRKIESYTGSKINTQVVEGLEPKKSVVKNSPFKKPFNKNRNRRSNKSYGSSRKY